MSEAQPPPEPLQVRELASTHTPKIPLNPGGGTESLPHLGDLRLVAAPASDQALLKCQPMPGPAGIHLLKEKHQKRKVS